MNAKASLSQLEKTSIDYSDRKMGTDPVEHQLRRLCVSWRPITAIQLRE